MRLHAVIARITGLSHLSRSAPAPTRETGVLVPANIVLDEVGDDPVVSCPRRWREDCRSYRLRLQVHLQAEIMRREHLDRLLAQLLALERNK